MKRKNKINKIKRQWYLFSYGSCWFWLATMGKAFYNIIYYSVLDWGIVQTLGPRLVIVPITGVIGVFLFWKMMVISAKKSDKKDIRLLSYITFISILIGYMIYPLMG